VILSSGTSARGRRYIMVNFLKKIKNLIFRIINLHLVVGPLTYNQDGLTTRHNCDFIRDPHFAAAYKQGKATGSWGDTDIYWRAYIACWAADKAKGIAGDFVECGVNRGGLSRAIIDYINFKDLNKHFYLLDTYNGLVDKYITKEEHASGLWRGGYTECYDSVVKTFSEFKNVIIIRGAVPDTLTQVPSKQVAYLSIDMNCVIPELAAIEFFWDRMTSGGVILLDDYGWGGHQLQKRAFDAFARKKDIKILTLPTGQGLIVVP